MGTPQNGGENCALPVLASFGSRDARGDAVAVEKNLSDLLSTLENAPDLDAAEIALTDLATAINMPTIAWAADISAPVKNPIVDAFMRRRGWSDDVLTLWWSRSVMLKSPLYIRCRFTAQPFATEIRGPRREYPPDLRHIEAAMQDMGLKSMITVPVHLPRGRISMLTFCGPEPLAVARDLLDRLQKELRLAGQLLMQAHDRQVPPPPLTADILSGLTPKEWECLRLTALGHREVEVARLMEVEKSTVRYHLRNVVAKMGASTRTHAVAIASQLGMIGTISP